MKKYEKSDNRKIVKQLNKKSGLFNLAKAATQKVKKMIVSSCISIF